MYHAAAGQSNRLVGATPSVPTLPGAGGRPSQPIPRGTRRPAVTQAVPILLTEGLFQSYGPKLVLHDVSIRLMPGAIGLLGPNGSGKSTLLRTLLGLLPLRQGRATVLGLDVATSALEVRRRIGLVPESECLVPGMTAVELTTYAGELVGMRHVDARERAHQVLYYVGLGEARYRDLGTYSQGMKQRLKLAQAMVHDPDLLLLDEPTNGMDPPGREAMLELIRDISRAKGVSVILSSHLLPDVKETCSEVLVLKDGRVVDHRPIDRAAVSERIAYDVRGRGALDELAQVLRADGHDAVPIDGGVRVLLSRGDGPEPIFEAVLRVKGEVEIRHLVKAHRSIEEEFLQAVS